MFGWTYSVVVKAMKLGVGAEGLKYGAATGATPGLEAGAALDSGENPNGLRGGVSGVW